MKQEIKERIEKIKKGIVPEGYIKTEYIVYPQNWIKKSFSELFTFSGGLPISRAHLNDEGIPYLHYGDIHLKNINFLDVKKEINEMPKLNINIDNVKENVLLKNGDIVFADASEDYEGIGKSVVIYNKSNLPIISGLHTIIGSSKDNSLTNDYKKYFVLDWSIRKQMMKLSTGISVLGISKENIGKIFAYLPPINEQKKIANILSTWDNAIELKEKLIKQKKKQKKGLMQLLLTGNKRLKGFSGKWKKYKLESICYIKKGVQINRLELSDEDMYPVINGGIEPSGYTDDWNTEANTITISEGGNSCGYVNLILRRFWCGGHCYALDIKSPMINKLFLYHILKYNEKNLMRLRVGSGLPNIQKKDINNFELFIPDIDEQNAIENILSTVDKEIELLEKQLEELKKQKKGLMQLLLTGIVRVTD